MSYDIYLQINTGKGERTVVEIGNYTSNIAPMYYKAFDKDWKFINGMRAGDAFDHILQAYKNMIGNPEEYRELNPSNGWGDYEGARDFLRKLLEECGENPECKIYISH